MATITKRGDAYAIRVSVGYDAQGRHKQVNTTYKPDPFTKTGRPKKESVIQKEVEAFAHDFERRVRAGEVSKGGQMKLSELATKFLEAYVEKELSPTSAADYRRIIMSRILPAFGHFKLSDINSLAVQEYYNKLYDSGKWSAATIKKDMQVFSSMLHRARLWGLVSRNPLDNVLSPRDKKAKPVKSFTLEQADLFLKALDMPYESTYQAHQRVDDTGKAYAVGTYTETHYVPQMIKLFFYVALYGGMRRGEIAALTWQDVEFDEGIIHISKNAVKVNGKIINKEPKSKTANRRVAVPNEVVELLLAWKEKQQDHFAFIGIPWTVSGYIFTQVDGSQMYPDTPTKAFRRIIEHYNELQTDESKKLPYISLHGLRHTSATLLISQNIDIKTVSSRLGHAQTSTTLNIYAHALEKMDRDAADVLGRLIHN